MSIKIIFMVLLAVLCVANLAIVISGTGSALNVVATIATAFSFGLTTTWDD